MRLDSVAAAASSYLVFLLTALLLIPVMFSILDMETMAELLSLTIAAIVSGTVSAILVEKPFISTISVLVGGFLALATLIFLPSITPIFPRIPLSWIYASASVLGGAAISFTVSTIRGRPAPETVPEKIEEPEKEEKLPEEKEAVKEVSEEVAEKKEERLEAIEKAIEETLKVMELTKTEEAEKAPEKELEELEKLVKREANLKKCPHCGEMIPADSIYCPLCGKKVEQAEG